MCEVLVLPESVKNSLGAVAIGLGLIQGTVPPFLGR